MQDKTQTIVDGTKEALEDLGFSYSFNDKSHVFSLRVRLSGVIYDIEIVCTDQYVCVITELPIKEYDDNIHKTLSEINKENAIGYLLLDEREKIVCRLAIGLLDTNPSMALIREAIIRCLQGASSGMSDLKRLLETK